MKLIVSFVMIFFLPNAGLKALVDEKCEVVKLADIGWTDISATTAVASEILTSLKYKPQTSVLSVAVTYAGLKNKDLDVFLGSWLPSHEDYVRPYLIEKSIVQLSKNLENGRYTIAVPEYAFEAGVRHFKDLNRFSKKFGQKIYGIESGNNGNIHAQEIIDQNAFGLGAWNLVESSEQGMLVAVKRAFANNKFIAFLGWEPHPMNAHYKIRYLDGGDKFFGANKGESTVYTVTRANFSQQCPNLNKFFSQIKFKIPDENEMMVNIVDRNMHPKKAAQLWLGSNVDVALGWLQGVKTIDGHSGQDAFKAYMMTINNFGNDPVIAKVPLGFWVDEFLSYLTSHFAREFRFFSEKVEQLINTTSFYLLQIPSLLLIALFCAMAYFLHRSLALCMLVLVGLLLILNLSLWRETIQTLVLVSVAATFSAVIGVPIGILCARREWFYNFLRPVLDLMQTIPPFVYLIPTLMLFGLGVTPGLISTIMFAIPAPIRMTYLGVKNVPKNLIEVAQAFGATHMQVLVKVELPSALPSIRAGFTQCIMLSLSMVVIAALVGGEGLGSPVVRALNTVNIERGFESGLAIVILAVLLDRILNKSQTKITPGGSS